MGKGETNHLLFQVDQVFNSVTPEKRILLFWTHLWAHIYSHLQLNDFFHRVFSGFLPRLVSDADLHNIRRLRAASFAKGRCKQEKKKAKSNYRLSGHVSHNADIGYWTSMPVSLQFFKGGNKRLFSFVCTNRTLKSPKCTNSPIKTLSILIKSSLKLIQKGLQGLVQQLNESFFLVSSIFSLYKCIFRIYMSLWLQQLSSSSIIWWFF